MTSDGSGHETGPTAAADALVSDEPVAAQEAVQPIAELFTAASSALWATTYNVDLALVSEYLLGRLGQPPLNVVVLADGKKLADSLSRIPVERAGTLDSVNRRWLLRPVPVAGAFHPKTYLQVTPGRAKLLIGSGNLNSSGLDTGHEVFTVFRSGTAIGDAALATWRRWMHRLVARVDDTTLALRFADLQQRLPRPALRSAAESPLIHNLDTPIVEQLRARVPSGHVDELWLTAPFFDEEAEAVAWLLEAFRPDRIHLHVMTGAKVDGRQLRAKLEGSGAELHLAKYPHGEFVHAKLVGVVMGNDGYVLSGSANLSRAALTLIPDRGGNIEMALFTPIPPTRLRALFTPLELPVTAVTATELTALRFETESAPAGPPVRLLTAAADAEGRVTLTSSPGPDVSWQLDDQHAVHPLTVTSPGQARSTGPVHGRLVRLVDASGAMLSQPVVVDDPLALAGALEESNSRTADDRPLELAAGDLESPLGRALQYLHQNLVMDVSERATATATAGPDREEGDSAEADDLWERLAREQLALDPRASTYARLWHHSPEGVPEPLIELLERMRNRVAAPPSSGGSSRPTGGPEDPTGGTRRWSVNSRVRVRARNVLRRWAAAQTDPRLAWVDPLAPAGNFAMVTRLLAELRRQRALDPASVEFDDADLDDLWLAWLRPFVGTGQADGWLDHLSPAERAAAVSRLPSGIAAEAAALCWLLVRPGRDHRTRVVNCQAVVRAALAQGLLDPTDYTVELLTAVTHEPLTVATVDETLVKAVEFLDDPMWCERVARELGLVALTLQPPPAADRSQLRLDVSGIDEPLRDPRVLRLVVAARLYRRCDGVALYAADGNWRLVFDTGEPVVCRRDRQVTYSERDLLPGELESLAGRDGTAGDLFAPSLSAAG